MFFNGGCCYGLSKKSDTTASKRIKDRKLRLKKQKERDFKNKKKNLENDMTGTETIVKKELLDLKNSVLLLHFPSTSFESRIRDFGFLEKIG